MEVASSGRKPFETLSDIRLQVDFDTLSRNIATSDPSLCLQVHFRSWKLTSSLSGVTFDIDQLEQWKHHKCVHDDLTDRLICNMTFSDQVMILTWGQISKINF